MFDLEHPYVQKPPIQLERKNKCRKVVGILHAKVHRKQNNMNNEKGATKHARSFY
jgi:hypothetical protein